ncbi:MAG: M1 family metallopeptidase [Bacteroidota bacterium]
MKQFLFFIVILSIFFKSELQSQTFTHQDTLRGSITIERVWWDLLHYNLNVKVDEQQKYISGSNTIKYKVLKSHQLMQIDLQEPLKILKVIQDKIELDFKRNGNVYYVELKKEQKIGDKNEIIIFYQGKPIESINPPWSGGLTWKKDKAKKSFIATTCQGVGASIWWPCKDHMYDEPDEGANIIITPPKGLMDVSNGKLIKTIDNDDGTKTFHWKVVNPINNYGLNINIADYSHFSEKYQGEKGILTCDYYVLPYSLKKAKIQFKQVSKMLEAFEYWFGPYPFYEDGYKLVEVPYLGMEHQSSVTYGNRFENGYLGKDLSGTGFGLKFDFIIIHESGHEWFANNITNKDIADMWIHEGFTTYSEVLYLDYHFSKEAGNAYAIGIRKNIKNDKPIIGIYNVNKEGSGDMYSKAAAMIHTLRQMMNDDKKFRQILRGMNEDFYHQTVTSQQIENYLSNKSTMNLNAFFNQYLRTVQIPVLEYKIENKAIKYRFKNIVKNFEIPVKVYVNNKEKWIKPNGKWQEIKTSTSNNTFRVDQNFYIDTVKKE